MCERALLGARDRRIAYKRLDLWTNSVLTAARSIYERAQLSLINEEPHHSFGQDLVGQTWSLDISGDCSSAPD
jgi:hypothetical protein